MGLGAALAALSAVIFGFGTTFARLAYDGGANPFTVVLLRTVAFTVVVALILRWLGRDMRLGKRATASTFWMAGALAVVSLGYQGSVAFIPVNLAALIFYSFPLMVALTSSAAGRDVMNARKAFALVAAFIGLTLILGPGVALLDWRGVALAFAAAFGMNLMLTFGGEATRDNDALVMSVYTNLWIAIALAAFTGLSGSLAVPLTPLGALGVAGVCVSYVAAYVCWYLALGLVRPVRLAALFNVEPLVTLFAAWLVLGERLSALQLAGAGLVLFSVSIVTASRQTEQDR